MNELLPSPGERLSLIERLQGALARYNERRAAAIKEIEETTQRLGLSDDDETVALALEQVDASAEESFDVEPGYVEYTGDAIPDFRPRIRMHEAGHIAAAHLLGLTVYSATIREQGGQVNYGSLLDNLIRREQMKMVKLAGFVAEGLIAGMFAPGDSLSDLSYYSEERFQKVIELLTNQTDLIDAISRFLDEHADTVTHQDLYGNDGPLIQTRHIDWPATTGNTLSKIYQIMVCLNQNYHLK